MSEVTREIVHDRRHGSGVIAWLALVVALVALTLAWMAYNRTGGDIEDTVQQGVERTTENVPDVDVDVDPNGTDNTTR